MSIRKAETTWIGTLKEGNGNMKVQSGAFDVPFTWGTRFGDVPGTNPEELVGAAHAGCFSMFLSAQLTANKTPPVKISTNAEVTLGRDDTGPVITKIVLTSLAEVPGISDDDFQVIALRSKQNCPVSRALASVAEVILVAKLV